MAGYQTLWWEGDAQGQLAMIDQTLLPMDYQVLRCTTVEVIWEAIRSLRVRGAPAIGVAAAYGIVVGLQNKVDASAADFEQRLTEVSDYLATSRPTAVNLFWAIDRMKEFALAARSASSADRLQLLLEEARRIDQEDRDMCDAIGRHGSQLLQDGMNVLTHCNAGGLATAGSGTALSVIFHAVETGKRIHVFADETRPLLQGARLTAWECCQREIPVTVICDNMAGQVMKEGRVDAVVVGADRIAANGDAANKIGTYSVAVLARYHKIPFYVAAPYSTFDLSLSHGGLIPIEQRSRQEIAQGFGRTTMPEAASVYNPAFDVTPAELITGIITEKGVFAPGEAAVSGRR